MGRLLRAMVLAAAVLAAAPAVRAHPLAPALLEVSEHAGGGADVRFRQSLSRVRGSELVPLLPPACARRGEPRLERRAGALVERFAIRCDAPDLTGLRFGVGGLDAAGVDALLRVERRDGRVVQAVLRGADASFAVPAAPRPGAVARGYAGLGVAHIAGGLDHLLFVLGLMLLVGRGARRLLATLTAFTAGHSVTLTLAVLGAVHLPTGPIELAIAGSIFVLALELSGDAAPRSAGRAAGGAARGGALRRRPWLLAGGFGLLHGLGFAGALAEVGLPDGEIPLALLSFNVGIELGQIAFVAAVLGIAALAARAGAPARLGPGSRLRAAPAWALGSLSAWWCFQRAAEWLG